MLLKQTDSAELWVFKLRVFKFRNQVIGISMLSYSHAENVLGFQNYCWCFVYTIYTYLYKTCEWEWDGRGFRGVKILFNLTMRECKFFANASLFSFQMLERSYLKLSSCLPHTYLIFASLFPFSSQCSLFIPLTISEILRFFDVFKGTKKRTLGRKGVK